MFGKINHQRRRFLGIAAMTIATTQLGRLGSANARSSNTQPKETITTQAGPAHSDPTAIRPFRVNMSEEAIVDLRRRITATQWPEKETVADQSQGVQLATMQKLASYWATDYDWRKVEATLNTLPQFITTIDDLDIHFIHVRSQHENALPLIVNHGWPGSIIEQLKIIEPTLYWLTNTGVSASRLYWEYKGGFFNTKGVAIPVAVTVFPGEQYEAPRSWTERAYPNLIYYNRAEKGGHFAAWEQPMIFTQELRAAFRSLRA